MARHAVLTISIFAVVIALAACGDDDEAPDSGRLTEPTYQNVAIIMARSCAVSVSCHGGAGSGSAMFNLQPGLDSGDFRPELMETSCEYSKLRRIAPGDSANSWLMIKLAGDFDPATGKLMFTPAADWDAGLTATGDGGTLPASNCPLVDRGMLSFGTIMPQPLGPPASLPANELELIRQWIDMGAPGGS